MTGFGERARHRWLAELFRNTDPAVREGIGDDAAILSLGSSHPYAFSTDSLLEGRHFDVEAAGWEAIGHKSAAVTLSDLAAMAAEPVCMLVSAGLDTDLPEEDVKTFFRGIERITESFSCTVAGGDLCGSDDRTFVTTAALGECIHGPVRRDGVQPGDELFVTGSLGGSLLGRHLSFTPRVREALAIAKRGLAKAMIDVSDGLTLDLDRLLEQSGGPGAVLYEEQIPVHPDAVEASESDDRTPLEHALGDGEDFELLLTAPPDRSDTLRELEPDGTSLTRIGRIDDGKGIRLSREDGSERKLDPAGYEHF